MELNAKEKILFIQKAELVRSAARILVGNILPFWSSRMVDNQRGGFYGRVDGHNMLHPDADKGAILNARILWSFSAAYRVLSQYGVVDKKCATYLKMAQRARTYILDHFIDKKNGGVYWSVNWEGNPSDPKKQTYAIAFTIYGLAEYARALKATGNSALADEYSATLDLALQLADDIEAHAYDGVNNGYIEALTEDWQPIDDMRLSEKDANSSRTMNTHLHVLEAYTNLIRAVPKERLDEHPINYIDKVENLVWIFTDKIMCGDGHLDLFFDDEWNVQGNIQSYGHDIEASWLLHEAVHVVKEVSGKTLNIDDVVVRIARASEKGYCGTYNLMYEKDLDTGDLDASLQWWVQCENVIGHLNLYQYFGADYEQDLNVAFHNMFGMIPRLLDNEEGEWYWSINADGTINRQDDKAGFWKCPYHNSRMCLEILERDIPCPDEIGIRRILLKTLREVNKKVK